MDGFWEKLKIDSRIVAGANAALFSLTPELETQARVDFTADIHRVAGPSVNPEDMHIRGMRIANSKRVAFYGRFEHDAGLKQVVDLLPGRAVMIEHDYTKEPVGRFFSAKMRFIEEGRTPRDQCYWAEALFMIPKDAQGDAIVRRIDSRIFAYNSLGWTFLDAVCSICKNDIRDIANCSHMPGEVYEQGGICDFLMRNVSEVFEGSIVYMGAARGTHFFDPTAPIQAAASATYPNGSEMKAVGIDGVNPIGEVLVAKAAALAAQASVKGLPFLAAPGRRVAAGGQRANIASLLLSKDRFETQEQAYEWARTHSFRTAQSAQSDDDFQYIQRSAGKEDKSKLITLERGVRAMIVTNSKDDGDARAVISYDREHEGIGHLFAPKQ